MRSIQAQPHRCVCGRGGEGGEGVGGCESEGGSARAQAGERKSGGQTGRVSAADRGRRVVSERERGEGSECTLGWESESARR